MMLPIFSENVGSILVVVAVCLASWYLITAFLSWYRLRHIPGPFLASISYLWVAYVALKAEQHEVNKWIREKYGPVVRIGPNEVITDDPDFIRRTGSIKGGYTRGDWYDGDRFNPYHLAMFTTKDTALHDKLKAKLSPAYSGRETPYLEDNVDEQVKNFVSLLRRKYAAPPGGSDFTPLDFTRVTGCFSLDVISRVGLGKEFGCLEADRDIYGFYQMLEEHLPMIALSTEVPLIRSILYSSLGLKIFGPRETDPSGLGKMMG